ncbi:uncharacterized protein J3D65DRAFT_633735, partial [Phyllosticta citribraziliensis]
GEARRGEAPLLALMYVLCVWPGERSDGRALGEERRGDQRREEERYRRRGEGVLAFQSTNPCIKQEKGVTGVTEREYAHIADDVVPSPKADCRQCVLDWGKNFIRRLPNGTPSVDSDRRARGEEADDDKPRIESERDAWRRCDGLVRYALDELVL